MTKRDSTWLVTFDGASARLFSVTRNPTRLREVESLSGPKRPELSSRPGRVHESVGERRSAMEPRSDPERLLEEEFVSELAARLARLAAEGRFDRLIVAGAPRALGCFRKAAPDSLRERILYEAPKDLTNTPAQDIPQSLDDLL